MKPGDAPLSLAGFAARLKGPIQPEPCGNILSSRSSKPVLKRTRPHEGFQYDKISPRLFPAWFRAMPVVSVKTTEANGLCHVFAFRWDAGGSIPATRGLERLDHLCQPISDSETTTYVSQLVTVPFFRADTCAAKKQKKISIAGGSQARRHPSTFHTWLLNAFACTLGVLKDLQG